VYFILLHCLLFICVRLTRDSINATYLLSSRRPTNCTSSAKRLICVVFVAEVCGEIVTDLITVSFTSKVHRHLPTHRSTKLNFQLRSLPFFRVRIPMSLRMA